jgi:hypothetical protein
MRSGTVARHFDLLDSFAKRQIDNDVRLILGIGLCAGTALFATVCSAAPSQQSSADTTYSNYAFASELGSGVYQINGSTIQVYQLTPSHRLRYAERPGKQPGLKLIFPVTVGFFDFQTQDLAHLQLPKNIGALSFEPGAELDYWITEDWHVYPYVKAGASFASSSQVNAFIYGFGTRSDVRFSVFDSADLWRATHLCRRNYTNYTASSSSSSPGPLPAPHLPNDSFHPIAQRGGVRARVGGPIHDRHFELGVYGIGDVYLNPLQGPASGISARTLQFEFGLMFGMDPMYQLWGMPLPRLGVGYLDAGVLSGWRLVIGNPF